MRIAIPTLACLLLSAVAGSGCHRDQGGGELHAKRVLLERDVKGMRASVAKLERGEPLFPEDAVLVSIDENVFKDFVDAQLPLTVDLESYHVELKSAKATFRGTPTVTLNGTIVLKDHPDLVGEVSAIGAQRARSGVHLDRVQRAEIAVDHVDLLQMAGLEKLLSGGTVDELARAVRLEIGDHLPKIEIPVKLDQTIDLPEVTDGPVRIHAASLPLSVSVADVVAGQGALWIAIRVEPGTVTDTVARP